MSFLLVLEDQQSGHPLEHVIVLDIQILSTNAQYTVDAWHDQVHVCVQLSSCGKLAVQQSAE